jgi:hypothetical protein
MSSEARDPLMGTPPFVSGSASRYLDYIAENTGRSNTLGTQSQDNCMLMRSSQHMVPFSAGLATTYMATDMNIVHCLKTEKASFKGVCQIGCILRSSL